ncbi:MAG: septal ring lytic transglycosylase RlpA family protein [Candidatus Aminicenantaceae bacterium]
MKTEIIKRYYRFIVLFIIIVVISFSCSRMNYFPEGNIQTGLASWYGPDFHGKETSNKEIYDMYDMTAAHKTLPFDTYVMVTNTINGKSVTVRINDRGPFVKDRIIDLSFAAAKLLDMIKPGVVPVKIEVLKKSSPKKSSQNFSVQVGAFIYKDNALKLKNKLSKKFKKVYISKFETINQTYFRVRIKAKNMQSAKDIAEKLSLKGYTVLVLEKY